MSGDALHAWRKEAGTAFTMILVAHRYLTFDPDDALVDGPLGHASSEHGFLRPTDANKALWEKVDAQARAVHANMVRSEERRVGKERQWACGTSRRDQR